jgi:hypothetical protein
VQLLAPRRQALVEHHVQPGELHLGQRPRLAGLEFTEHGLLVIRHPFVPPVFGSLRRRAGAETTHAK